MSDSRNNYDSTAYFIAKFLSDLNATESKPHNNSTPEFWMLHPVGRGLSTGLVSGIFSSVVTFKAGFLYGALSGIFNIGTHAIARRQQEKIFSPEVQALAYLATVGVPWVAAGLTMRYLHKISPSPLHHLTWPTAIASTIPSELFGTANEDLFVKKPRI